MKIFAMVSDDRWSISKADLETKLRERWAAIPISDVTTGDAYVLKWEGPEIYEGRLAAAGDAIVMEGEIDACARVAVWFRGLVPATHTMQFFDEGYSASVDIRPGMTAEDLAAHYLADVNA